MVDIWMDSNCLLIFVVEPLVTFERLSVSSSCKTVGIFTAAKLDILIAGPGKFLDDDRGGQAGVRGAFLACIVGLRRDDTRVFRDDVLGVFKSLPDMCFSMILGVLTPESKSCLRVSGR